MKPCPRTRERGKIERGMLTFTNKSSLSFRRKRGQKIVRADGLIV